MPKLEIRTLIAIPMVAGMLLAANPASADIILMFSGGSGNPAENLLFNQAGLDLEGDPIQGATNTTGTIVSIDGSEDLKGSDAGGQAVINALDGTAFASAGFDLLDTELYFTDFKADVFLLSTATGAPQTVNFTLTAYDNFGTAFELDGSGTTSGSNFIRIQAVIDPNTLLQQYIDWVMISITDGTERIKEIKQVRIGGIQELPSTPPPPPVPEPGTLVLFGLGLIGAARTLRKRS